MAGYFCYTQLFLMTVLAWNSSIHEPCCYLSYTHKLMIMKVYTAESCETGICRYSCEFVVSRLHPNLVLDLMQEVSLIN